MKNEEKKTASKSFSRRMIRVWILGVAIPLIVVEMLILGQFFGMNHKDVDEEIERTLNKASADFTDLMSSMNSFSWLMDADETVGKDLHLYFDENDTNKKANILIYLREQISNYEVANPAVGNLTYIYVPEDGGEPVKINQTSLATGELPEERYFLCSWRNVSFYGPHPSKSKVAAYPCLSLLRRYKQGQEPGEVYIYLESGFRYFQKLLPAGVMGMDPVFLIESQNGKILYSSDEQAAPVLTDMADMRRQPGAGRYKTYVKEGEGGFRLHLWVPVREYYRVIYGLALNFSVVTILAVILCFFVSLTQWHSIYKPFTDFEKKLHQIAEDSDVETKVEQMHIQEFDESFALLGRLKNNILLLLNRVQEEEKRRSDLELKVVMGKINPHFLYNTLDTLKWYASGKKDREMVHFITSLNKLLLYNMSKTGETILKNELDAIGAYIVLQQLKYDIAFSMDTGKHPEILQAEMPRFVLQPIVENAILHSGTNQGKIRIEVELLASGKIAILVKNNGLPIDPQKIRDVLVQKSDISSNGIGLQYVSRVLENRFGSEFELRAERTADGFNVVEIRIPFEAAVIARDDKGITRGYQEYDKGLRG